MAMLSLPSPKPTGPFLHTSHHHDLLILVHRRLPLKKRSPPPIAATKLPFSRPPPSPPGEVYQPFRPPPSSSSSSSSPSSLPPQYRHLNPSERLAVLRDRLGLWHEYAPLISYLARDGFNPPSIEEATGLSGVDQNRLVVAVQVRDSLVQSQFDRDLLTHFDSSGGAEHLYELRLLNAAQRAAAARRLVEHRLDPKAAQELARAMKDFPRRRGSDDAWYRFSGAEPGDCLAYARFRLSREAVAPADKIAALEKALEAADTEGAKNRILEELEKVSKGGGEGDDAVTERIRVPLVRLRYGEVAETSAVAVLPAVKAAQGEEGVLAAPEKCMGEGEFGVVAAERGWARWVVLPGWAPVMELSRNGGGVAVEFADGRVLPWRRREGGDEAALVVADRGRKAVAEEHGYYLAAGNGGLGVERGDKLLEKGIKQALGAVVLVVRPPREEDDDQLADEDWD